MDGVRQHTLKVNPFSCTKCYRHYMRFKTNDFDTGCKNCEVLQSKLTRFISREEYENATSSDTK